MRSRDSLEKCLNLAKQIDLKLLEECAVRTEGEYVFFTQDGFEQPLRPVMPVLSEFLYELWHRAGRPETGYEAYKAAEVIKAAVNEWRDAYLEEIQTEAI